MIYPTNKTYLPRKQSKIAANNRHQERRLVVFQKALSPSDSIRDLGMTWSEVRAHFSSFQKGHILIGSMMESIGSYILIIIATISILRYTWVTEILPVNSMFYVIWHFGWLL